MVSLDRSFLHFSGDRRACVPSQPVNTGANQEVGAQFVRQMEQLKDVALPISDMHTISGIACKGSRLTQVFQPADALLLCYRHSRRVDLLFQGIAALELFAGPKLDGRQSEWQSIQGDGQAAVHENATHRDEFDASILALATGRSAKESNLGILVPLKGELTSIMEHQNFLVRLGKPLTRGLEMARHDLVLAHPGIGEKAVSRLGVGPILTDIRNTFADSVGHHSQ